VVNIQGQINIWTRALGGRIATEGQNEDLRYALARSSHFWYDLANDFEVMGTDPLPM
jgi:hypothetical protein